MPAIREVIRRVIEPEVAGDPQSSLLWVSGSLRKVSVDVKSLGYETGYVTLRDLLHDMDFSLKGNRKTGEGKRKPDSGEQFMHINSRAKEFMGASQPVISVDARKKEPAGEFKDS